jgi:hypothetical protein
MKELLEEFSEQLKKMPKEEKDLQLAKLLKQKEKARIKSKEVAKVKKASGIKQLSIDVSEQDLNKFKELMQKVRYNKTELLQKMMQIYERSLQNQQQQQLQNPQQNKYDPQQKR